MGLFIIGDVHGCLYTYIKLMEHWDPKTETLIQLGDLIDRGNHSSQCIKLAFELQSTFKDQAIFLRGNHEQMMIEYLNETNNHLNWLNNGGVETLQEFKQKEVDPFFYLGWIKSLPLTWHNDHVMVSHAGFSVMSEDPFDVRDTNGLLWNRKPLLNIGKTQVIGHTPRLNGKPEYSAASNSWNIDTGAYRNICLTGIRMRKDGKFLEAISVPTDERDLTKEKVF
ncbi:metallophosphoesterase family protein [Mongoliibacter ruber]|uniref:Serine/threonine protein phosphatase 1 n=1 Tax=Mongoliibacter ruber TaxID=1750599 RepID=A0A2T0WFN3_9BACT|nr:metallophosphoesterase family protein [Mongoliibacter ruber]PRY85475.1 serine/threonine protein phosphatase 1 [Mongoliibacter ruber]